MAMSTLHMVPNTLDTNNGPEQSFIFRHNSNDRSMLGRLIIRLSYYHYAQSLLEFLVHNRVSQQHMFPSISSTFTLTLSNSKGTC